MIEADVANVGRVWISTTDDPVKPGPYQRNSLPSDLSSRVKALKQVLDEVYPKSLEEWEDGFLRDLHPEKEVAICERIAAVYEATKHLTKDEPGRREAFKVLLTCSVSNERDVLHVLDIRAISRSAAKQIISMYYHGE